MTAEQRRKIEELYLEMFDMLLTYASASLEEPALAEEAVQETFQMACQKPMQLLSSENPKGWLVNTLKYTICNMKRRRDSARQLLAKYLISQTKDIAISEDNLRLDLMYENIAETDEFQILRQMAIEGKSHLEMATERGISISACKKRVQRAKEKLKDKIKI